VASIPRRFFEVVAELFLIGFLGFGGCAARFLIAQTRFFQQPPATRIGVLDAVGFFKKLLDERRRVDPDFPRWVVDSFFELLLLFF
jgi:hypothetical protein